MKFNRLTLTNIKSYYGSHDYNLAVDKRDQNVILFGGLNGAGKTTILEAIRLALYGPLAYGFKTESNTYLETIKGKLNIKAVSRKEPNYMIRLELEYVENLKRNTYELIRSWKFDKDKVKEQFDVIKNREHLNELDKDLFISRLHGEVPPQLFEFCLFDGEEIARIINDGLLSDYLKGITKVMFNLDLFENLQLDLNQYLKNNKDRDFSAEEKLAQEKRELLVTIEEEQKQLLANINNIEDTLSDQLAKRDELKKEFKIYGGLVKEERDKLLTELNEMEYVRQKNNDETKEFVSNLLPIFLVKDLLKNVKAQMEKETEYEMFDFLQLKLSADDFHNVANKLSSNGLVNTDNLDKISQILYENTLKIIKPENTSFIHRASFVQRSSVESTIEQLDKVEPSRFVNNFSNNQNLVKKIHSIRKQVENNDNSSEFKDLLEEIDKLTETTEKNKLEIAMKKEQLATINDKVTHLKKELDNIRAKQLESKKTETTYTFSTKVIEVSQQFCKFQLKKKLQEVEFQALIMINKLLRKDEYITNISISTENFDVTLFNAQRELVEKRTLSAGEKQVLLLSLIWGILKVSGRKLPLVFDTLLGRLDSTHKENILKNLIPTLGEQVIILATDSEIDEKHFNFIRNSVSRCYTIEFHKENLFEGQVGFFNFGELGVG